MQEVRFITNSFSAEYGRSAGGVLAAAGKTGANQVHGSAYDYHAERQVERQQLGQQSEQRRERPAAAQRIRLYPLRPGVLSEGLQRQEQDVLLLQLGTDQRSRRQHSDRQVPTALQKSGDFSQTFTSAGALIRIYDPLTTVADPVQRSGYSRSPFPGNVIPPTASIRS